ncbi:LOW QUALITY PROTEIN: tRNA-dihydrouridine(47) synthase [NAD(P)(+)]-like [Pterocles gutturalis]
MAAPTVAAGLAPPLRNLCGLSVAPLVHSVHSQPQQPPVPHLPGAVKPPDLGRSCVLFKTFGKCIYGVTCRFAQAHLGDGCQNIVNTDLAKQWEGKSLVRNNLSKDLHHQLRKRKFIFKKAGEYLRGLAKPHGDGGERGKATGRSAEEQEVSDCTRAQESLGDGPECPAVSEQGEDPNPAALQSRSPTGGEEAPSIPTVGPLTNEDVIKLRLCEKKKLEIQGKLYLTPLTTCGNLPFRRICKRFGADITCGEMAVCTNLLHGQSSEWALLKWHRTEDISGVQLEGAFLDTMTKCAELLNQTIEVDFVDINVGCPINLVYKKGGGCALMTRSNKFEQIIGGMNSVLGVLLTVKIRTGVQEKINVAHKLIPKIRDWGAATVTLHGRSREQRYTRSADWDYIAGCAKIASPMPLFGNGDILSYEDANRAMQLGSGIMVASELLLGPVPTSFTFLPKHKDPGSVRSLASGSRQESSRLPATVPVAAAQGLWCYQDVLGGARSSEHEEGMDSPHPWGPVKGIQPQQRISGCCAASGPCLGARSDTGTVPSWLSPTWGQRGPSEHQQ